MQLSLFDLLEEVKKTPKKARRITLSPRPRRWIEQDINALELAILDTEQALKIYKREFELSRVESWLELTEIGEKGLKSIRAKLDSARRELVELEGVV